MSQLVPWMFCFGIFLVLPGVAFALGLYIGRNGVPLQIDIKRKGDVDEDVGFA